MITRLTLRNFKSVGDEVYDFTNFDLLVGRNNSGKSTILQALAIWQFCIDEFRRSKRSGKSGVQVVLPNFTSLPLPEFNLLWKDKTDRIWPERGGEKKQEYVTIDIIVEWKASDGRDHTFGVNIRYGSPQAIYAIPSEGWKHFRECEGAGLPFIAHVPPFSGLEPSEKWLDSAPMRQQVGKGQPGSVLRNLLLRVTTDRKKGNEKNWKELAEIVKKWFAVDLQEPNYDSQKDVYINVEYKHGKKNFDIIAGGSGFHQTLTLLAFLYGYQPTTILLDEPDAHLHVNLQREILDFFKDQSQKKNVQFIIATHAEEFIRGVDAAQIISLLNQKPKRIDSTPDVLRAMADVSNDEIVRAQSSPYIVYVEGESDERILRAWAKECEAEKSIEKICFKVMGGGSKSDMKDSAEKHFLALKKIVPHVKKLMIFDFDDDATAFHPPANNLSLFEWKRKNIENYLLVPDSWKRAALKFVGFSEDTLFSGPIVELIDEFFRSENLILPPNKTWRIVDANIFSAVDGKKILFENRNALFQKLKVHNPSITLPREEIAGHMALEEIHEDVHLLMRRIKTFVSSSVG